MTSQPLLQASNQSPVQASNHSPVQASNHSPVQASSQSLVQASNPVTDQTPAQAEHSPANTDQSETQVVREQPLLQSVTDPLSTQVDTEQLVTQVEHQASSHTNSSTEEAKFRASEESRTEQESNNREESEETPRLQADIEYLSNPYSNSEDFVCLVPSPTECIAPTRASGSRPQSIHIEQESQYTAPPAEKIKLLKSLNFKLVQMMETVGRGFWLCFFLKTSERAFLNVAGYLSTNVSLCNIQYRLQ